MGPLEWLATTPRQLVAMADRRREEIKLDDFRMAVLAAPIYSFAGGRAVSPAQLLGLEEISAEISTEPVFKPGSKEEDAELIRIFGAVRKVEDGG